MDIQQEYCRRTGVLQPPIRYPESEYAVLRRKAAKAGDEKAMYLIAHFTFQQKANDNRPGMPVLQEMTPLRGSTGNQSFQIRQPKKAEWGEEWEAMIKEWAKSFSSDYDLVKPEELEDASWEVFVFVNESWMGSNLDDAKLDQLHTSLFSNNPEVKKKARAVLSQHFRRYDSSIMMRYVSQSLNHMTTYFARQTYADWLTDVFCHVENGGAWV